MTSLIRALAFSAVFALALGTPISALAEAPPPVTQSVTIDTNGKTDLLLMHAKKNQMIFERLGIKATRRYLMGTLAGASSGDIIVAIDYPNLAALAEAQAKLSNDKEWQKYIDMITDSGMIVTSNSLWVDITP